MRLHLTLRFSVVALALLWSSFAYALVPPAGFDMTGFIQRATRAQVGATPAVGPLRGGTLTINGIEMIVPNNSVVQMPAASLTWAQLFDPAVSASVGYDPPRPNHANGRTGLSLQDPLVTHFPAYEVRVVGNILSDPVTGAQTYVVGLVVPVTQQGLNGGSGLINYIDYDGSVLGNPGRFCVGGLAGDPTTGTIIEINDPVGRFGVAHSPDPRFTADTNNPTISTASGYPVGIPVSDPALQDDPLRPATQRPLNGALGFPVDPFLPAGAPLRSFTMPAPAPGVTPDSRLQVPLMVGDWVDFSGTLMKLNPLGNNSPANMFVSVHTLTANLGIQTAPGTNPAYIRVEEMLFGSGPSNPPAAPAQETSNRVQMVAFTTDPTATASIFAIDVDPTTGVETEVPFPNGANIPMNDPVRGRIRLQTSKNLPDPPGNAILSPSTGTLTFTREYIVKLVGASRQVADVANGLTAGQYRLPIFEYIFPEGAVFGEPIPPYNFNDFNFLAIGSGRLNGTTGPAIGRLDPWPGP